MVRHYLTRTFSAFSTSREKSEYSTDEIKRIADIIAGKLSQNSNFKVIDRMHTKDSILCPEAIVISTITRFDIDSKESTRSFLGFGKGKTKKSAYVEFNIRIINNNTKEIIYSFTDSATISSTSDSSVTIPNITLDISNDNTSTIDNNNSSNSNTFTSDINDKQTTKFILRINSGKAMKIKEDKLTNEGSLMTLAAKEVINKITSNINDNSQQIISSLRPFGSLNSLVIDSYGDKKFFVLNHGILHGYKKGMKLKIKRINRILKDPQTKEIIRVLTEDIATVTLTDVNHKSSIATITDIDNKFIVFGDSFLTDDIKKEKIIAIPIK